MKIFVLSISLALYSVVTAYEVDDAPPDSERVMKHSAEESKSPSTDTPFRGIDVIELKTPLPSTKSEQPPPQTPNLLPIRSDCFGSFPGTPAWNECMKRFQEDMAENGRRIKEMTAIAPKMSQSSYSHSGRSSSNSILGGYSIKTENIPQSNMITNGVIKIILHVNDYDNSFKIANDGRVITISGVQGGQRKFAEIRIPNNVIANKVDVKKSGQAIVISGPVSNGNTGSVQMSQSGGGFSFSSSGNQAAFPPVFPPVPMQPFNPFPPMEDFGKKMHGFFDGFHKNFFGMGNYKSPDYEQPRPKNNGGFVWFV